MRTHDDSIRDVTGIWKVAGLRVRSFGKCGGCDWNAAGRKSRAALQVRFCEWRQWRWTERPSQSVLMAKRIILRSKQVCCCQMFEGALALPQFCPVRHVVVLKGTRRECVVVWCVPGA